MTYDYAQEAKAFVLDIFSYIREDQVDVSDGRISVDLPPLRVLKTAGSPVQVIAVDGLGVEWSPGEVRDLAGWLHSAADVASVIEAHFVEG